ncbi:hypothetical protein M885DRAFT_539172 [Pelagophyceae sp. CCMP2097]|nr:hypothetical protein M885DRAFT_539172 [Pelagophyceae sp. CCMP2097]
MAALLSSLSGVQGFIDSANDDYEELHLAFEEQFWGTKMALSGSFSTAQLSATKEATEAFLRDAPRLAEARRLLALKSATEDQRKVLALFVRTFACYQMPSDRAVKLRRAATKLEDELSAKRNAMRLGYTAADGAFVELSSVGLRTLCRTADDEATRRAAYEGLRSIGAFVLDGGFCDLVKQRNAMAKELGFECYYDYKVTNAEGFGKKRLFEILDGLRAGSAALCAAARARLAADKGAAALEPWNTSFVMAGDVEKRLDAYFPFEKSVEVWGRSFCALGIRYRGAEMTLDLLDRKGKYSNGFCHWPQPAWVRPDGSWQPSRANFTSLADPGAVGSGRGALTTLMHEAGHAAHFANVSQPSPLASQERAPTSVAYAETQSMFLDALAGDAAWRARYARDRGGAALPWDAHEADLRASHPFGATSLAAMLAVPYFEKALYELADEDVTPERVAALADAVEVAVQGGPSSRPLLSVPHVLSDEASCYYHGYVLALMAVHQTREHFGGARGIVDNAAVGPSLAEHYWLPGNSRPFLELVGELTGRPLDGAAWLAALEEDVEARVSAERADYIAFAEKPPPAGDVDLDMRIRIIDGDEHIADSNDGGFLGACKAFEAHIVARFSPKAT